MIHRLLTLALLLVSPVLAESKSSTTRPFAGIAYEHQIRSDPPQHLHVVTIDLRNPRIHLRVRPAGDDPDGNGPWTTTLLAPSIIAKRDQLDLAVNGDFFIPKDTVSVMGRSVPYFANNWAQVTGLAISDGRQWSPPKTGRYALLVDQQNRLSIGEFNPPPKGARQAIGGSPVLIRGGKKLDIEKNDPAPRTAVGFDREQKRLVLLVVDGRRPQYSAGLSIQELADEMLRLGCDEALNLDGGGSSTLVLRNSTTGQHEVINKPSDGHDLRIPLSLERPVANVLGITVDP